MFCSSPDWLWLTWLSRANAQWSASARPLCRSTGSESRPISIVLDTSRLFSQPNTFETSKQTHYPLHQGGKSLLNVKCPSWFHVQWLWKGFSLQNYTIRLLCGYSKELVWKINTTNVKATGVELFSVIWTLYDYPTQRTKRPHLFVIEMEKHLPPDISLFHQKCKDA